MLNNSKAIATVLLSALAVVLKYKFTYTRIDHTVVHNMWHINDWEYIFRDR